jgi:hypothetical protein
MEYYVTNVKPEVVRFEANEKGYGGREFQFTELEDGRWAISVDCIKYIEDKYQKEVIPCAKQISISEKTSANSITDLMKTASIVTDVRFKVIKEIEAKVKYIP